MANRSAAVTECALPFTSSQRRALEPRLSAFWTRTADSAFPRDLKTELRPANTLPHALQLRSFLPKARAELRAVAELRLKNMLMLAQVVCNLPLSPAATISIYRLPRPPTPVRRAAVRSLKRFDERFAAAVTVSYNKSHCLGRRLKAPGACDGDCLAGTGPLTVANLVFGRVPL